MLPVLVPHEIRDIGGIDRSTITAEKTQDIRVAVLVLVHDRNVHTSQPPVVVLSVSSMYIMYTVQCMTTFPARSPQPRVTIVHRPPGAMP